MYRLRRARPSDADALADVQVETVRAGAGDGYTDEHVAFTAPPDPDPTRLNGDLFDATDRLAVLAERDGSVVGFGDGDLAEGYLARLFVRPGDAGTGVGGRCLRVVAAAALALETDTLSAYAALPAVEFYQAGGYEAGEHTYVGGDRRIPVIERTNRLE